MDDSMGIVYLLLVIGVGYYANKKGRSPIGWAILALITTPLFAALILAFLKNLKDKENLQQVIAQQEQINDRMSVNEVNTNRRFDDVENRVEELAANQGGNGRYKRVGAAAKMDSIAGGENSADADAEPEVSAEPVADPVSESVEPAVEAPVVMASAVGAEGLRCPYCEGEIAAESKFCGHCGAKL